MNEIFILIAQEHSLSFLKNDDNSQNPKFAREYSNVAINMLAMTKVELYTWCKLFLA